MAAAGAWGGAHYALAAVTCMAMALVLFLGRGPGRRVGPVRTALLALVAGGTVVVAGGAQLAWISRPAKPTNPAALRGRTLTVKDVAKVSLRGADLSGAVLDGVDLRGRCLDGADLSGASLKDTQMDGASLRGALLRGAKVDHASLRGADLTDTDVTGTDLSSADTAGSSGAGAPMRRPATTVGGAGGSARTPCR